MADLAEKWLAPKDERAGVLLTNAGPSVADANANDKRAPKLIPGPAARNVLGRRAASGDSDEDEAGSEPSAVAPGGSTSTTAAFG